MSDWYLKKTIATLLDEAAARFGGREMLVHEQRRLGFDTLHAEVTRAARGFIAAGIQAGDKVVLWMPNRPEWIISLFALSRIGAITVPANTRFRTVDLQYVMRQSDATTLITVDRSGPVDYLSMTRELIPEIESGAPRALSPRDFPALRRVIIHGVESCIGTLAWEQVLAGGAATPPEEVEHRHRAVDPDGTTLMLYTSGTTGFPKGVMHCHNIQRNVVDIANRLGYRSDDVMLMYWPLFHVVGIYLGPLMSVVAGTRMVLTTTFDAAESLRLIEVERVSPVWGFDTQLGAILEHPDRENTDLSSLRAGVGAVGMVSSERAARRAQSLLCPTVSGWGMTEVGAGVTLGYPDDAEEDRWLTSGHPLPGLEFKVMDPETGETVPDGELGELCARGYSVMQGYYRKPEETARAVDADGWLHTGDMATRRADGAIRFLGRYKDLLKVGGENVDPAEVEGFLLDHPEVAGVQVVGAPHARLGEVVCACVVPRTPDGVTHEALVSFCRGKLASFKIPRHTLVLEAFPTTPSGKPQKFRLREQVNAMLQDQASEAS